MSCFFLRASGAGYANCVFKLRPHAADDGDAGQGAQGGEKLLGGVGIDGIEILKAKGYEFFPADAPGKKLTVRVYIKLWYDGETGAPMTEVHLMTPKYEPEAPKPTAEETAKAATRDYLIRHTMEAKGISKDEAVSILLELGLIEAE